jgi:hypothetical protein
MPKHARLILITLMVASLTRWTFAILFNAWCELLQCHH